MTMRQRGLAAACACALACSGLAQDVVIKKPGAVKSGVDLSAFESSAGEAPGVFLATLKDDLLRGGWFSIVPAGAGTIALRGECRPEGGALAVRCQAVHAATAQVYLSKAYRASQAEARRLAHQVADDIVLAVKQVKGIASSRIAMVGARGGRKDVFVCDADGRNLVQLTQDAAICLSPAWSPDARQLVYTSFLSGFPDVYLIDLVTKQRRRIAGFAGLNSGAEFSPDGRSMALTLSKDGNPELYTMDLGGGRLTRLTHSRHAAEASPTWSPDGRQIAFVSDQSGSPQVYVLGHRERQAKRITFQGSENVAPDWGPDGRIAFSSRRGGCYQICVYDAATGRDVQLTAGGADHEDPSWAPNGRHLVYVRTERYHADLYILDTLGDPEVRLTAISGEWYSPAWTP
jgi:TolB protein